LHKEDVQEKMKEYEIMEDGLLMHKNIIYISSSRELRNLVLKEMHNVPYARHIGYKKTITVVRIQLFLSRMKMMLLVTSPDVWNVKE
jgi:hypothetical protein